MTKSTLLEKFRRHTAVTGVVGLGYVGLPLAVEKARVGFPVIGIDCNAARVHQINAGENYIDDVDNEVLRELVQKGQLSADATFDRIPEMDAIVICVPTPLTKSDAPDLSYIESVTRSLAPRIRPGQLISLESTTYPGTTEELMLPILEEASGLKVNRDFYLVYSPERINPGDRKFTTTNTIKVVGGCGDDSLEVGLGFYGETIEQLVPVSSPSAAEMVKLWENTYRAINIAGVNDLARLCHRMGINVWEVLKAAFTKPYGIQEFWPGPGVGGHCIPLDPYYLGSRAAEHGMHLPVIGLAGEVNRRTMPRWVVQEKIYPILNTIGKAPRLSTVLILGVAYKKDIADPRESPALTIIEHLLADGVQVLYHDPLVPNLRVKNRDFTSLALTPELLHSIDVAALITDHTAFDYTLLAEHGVYIVDTRNAFGKRGLSSPKVVAL